MQMPGAGRDLPMTNPFVASIPIQNGALLYFIASRHCDRGFISTTSRLLRGSINIDHDKFNSPNLEFKSDSYFVSLSSLTDVQRMVHMDKNCVEVTSTILRLT